MYTTPPVVGQQGLTKYQQDNSVSQAVDGGIELAFVIGVDANGWANDFKQANMRGTIVRVGASGNPSPSGNQWTGANTKINHSLGFIPNGWVITYKNKIVDIIAGTTNADAQFIYLTTSDTTAEINLYIF